MTDLTYTQKLELAKQIDKLENEYNAFGRQAEDYPHLWGEYQESQVAECAAKLRKLYDRAGIDSFNRIQGI